MDDTQYLIVADRVDGTHEVVGRVLSSSWDALLEFVTIPDDYYRVRPTHDPASSSQENPDATQ